MSTIFITDLDGTLLGHDDFGFAAIRDDILAFLAAGVPLIPNSSKTRAEIEYFCQQLGLRLPFICENGAALVNADLLGTGDMKIMPRSILAGRSVDELMSAWIAAIDPDLRASCVFLDALDEEQQTSILGLSGDDLARALARDYSVLFRFVGDEQAFASLRDQAQAAGLSIHRGGRVCCLSGQHDKSTFNSLIRDTHRSGGAASSMVGFGDSENDVAMLCTVDVACVVPRPGVPVLRLPDPPDTVIIAPKPAPEGWIIAANEAVMALQQNRQASHG